MSRIFWDTNLFIYLIEDFRDLSERVTALRRRVLERGDELYTSALTLGEIMIKPLEAGDEGLAVATNRCCCGAPWSFLLMSSRPAYTPAFEGSHYPTTRCNSARLRRTRARRSVYHE